MNATYNDVLDRIKEERRRLSLSHIAHLQEIRTDTLIQNN